MLLYDLRVVLGLPNNLDTVSGRRAGDALLSRVRNIARLLHRVQYLLWRMSLHRLPSLLHYK